MAADPGVLIVDDDRDLALSLQDALSADGLPNFAFGSAESFLQFVSTEQRGCVLLDVHLPGMSGVECQEVMRSRGIQLPVIVMTGAATVADTIRAFENAAFRFFEKPADAEALLEVVHQAIAVDLQCQSAAGERCRRLGQLTGRELEVLELLIQDKSTKQIARQLGLSASTVEKHRAKILAKAGVNSVVGLARLRFSAQQEALPAAHLRFSKPLAVN